MRCPEKDLAGPWTRPPGTTRRPPACHPAGTTRSNQKQELPTTGQTSKAHGIALTLAADLPAYFAHAYPWGRYQYQDNGLIREYLSSN